MKKPDKLPEVEPVKLKPLWGIRPGVYLLVLYTAIIALAVFLVCFLPGIAKGGRYVRFSSPLSETGLYVDGIYKGVTDYQYFIPSGEHTLSVRKADITVSEETITVDHPVFLTWLFRRTRDVATSLRDLTDAEKKAIISFDLGEIERYSAILTYSAVTVYPPLFANLKQDVEALGWSEQVYGLAASYITTKEMLEDAKAIGSSDPLYGKAIQAAETMLSGSGGRVGLTGAVPGAGGKRVSLSGSPFKLEGIRYDGGEFVMGSSVQNVYSDVNAAGVSVSVAPFAIATVPVTESQYALFLKDHPEWKNPDRTQADTYYLAGTDLENSPSDTQAIVNVSHAAAEAFCAWLSDKTGTAVRLPSEKEWAFAALASSWKRPVTDTSAVDDGTDDPSGMTGKLWNMTSTPYIPLSRLVGYEETEALAASYGLGKLTIVRGGNAGNRKSVGVVRTDDTGDAIGFRVAWTVDDGKN